jgi:hypothetical protein
MVVRPVSATTVSFSAIMCLHKNRPFGASWNTLCQPWVCIWVYVAVIHWLPGSSGGATTALAAAGRPYSLQHRIRTNRRNAAAGFG